MGRTARGLAAVHISIHALREEGDFRYRYRRLWFAVISIHALREEGDKTLGGILSDLFHFYPRPPRGGRLISALLIYSSLVFLSTPSARRATRRIVGGSGQSDISIHALREEGDRRTRLQRQQSKHFYPRPPRGGRHRKPMRGVLCIQFLSTPSARRATCYYFSREPVPPLYFYPRPPRGGRPLADLGCTITSEFLSTPSARRAT